VVNPPNHDQPRPHALRDITATQIPSGDKTTLRPTKVMIHQTLGGSYTVQSDSPLPHRRKDGDAIGETVADHSVKASTLTDGAPDPEAIWAQLRHVFDPEIPSTSWTSVSFTRWTSKKFPSPSPATA